MAKPGIDISGKTFFHLTAVRYLGNRRWLCQCDCGNTRDFDGRDLRSGSHRSCGCRRGEWAKTHGRSKTLLYKRWANMIQKCSNPKHPSYSRFGGGGISVCTAWRQSFEEFSNDMREMPSHRHWIMRRDATGDFGPGNCYWGLHGGLHCKKDHPAEWQVWAAMRQRCKNKNSPAYENYGGRGIRVCRRWQGSFSDFFDDVGARPSSEHTIERMDNNGDYEPGNVRWATMADQELNKRTTRWVEYRGTKYPLVVLARKYGLSSGTLRDRLEYGWSVERAVNEPVRQRNRGRDNGKKAISV